MQSHNNISVPRREDQIIVQSKNNWQKTYCDAEVTNKQQEKNGSKKEYMNNRFNSKTCHEKIIDEKKIKLKQNYKTKKTNISSIPQTFIVERFQKKLKTGKAVTNVFQSQNN